MRRQSRTALTLQGLIPCLRDELPRLTSMNLSEVERGCNAISEISRAERIRRSDSRYQRRKKS